MKNTYKSIEQSDIVIIVADQERGITNTDMALFGLCKKYKKAFIVVINKWDLTEDKNRYNSGRFYHHDMLDVDYISCKSQLGIKNLKKKILEITGYCQSKVDTGKLNKWCRKYLNNKNPSMRIKYITQTSRFPPTFAVNINFKNTAFIAVLQKEIRKEFYKNANVPVVIKLIR